MWFEDYERIIYSCIIIILASLFFFKGRKKRNVPPGPPKKFLIGSTFLFKPKAYEVINDMSKKYGPIYQFYFFGQPIVVLSDYKIIKEALVRQGDIFSGRPKAHVWETYSNKSGIAFNQGESMMKQKKFALQVLRQFGIGKGNLEEKIRNEIEFLCKYIKDEDGQPCDLKRLLMETVINVIQSVLFSNRIDDKALHRDLIDVIDEIFEQFTMTNPVNFFPPLGYVFESFKKFKKNIQFLREMMANYIKNHEETFDSKNIRDYIDSYLEKEQENKQLNINDSSFTRFHLLVTLTDFFLAGIESVSSTMLWSVIYLMHYPDIQEKIQKEMDSVLGPNEYPKMSDRKDLPFTHATLLEVQRYCNLAPLSIAHCTTDKTSLCGYDIPKGVWVLENITGVHFDSNYWHEPYKFDPKRFLDSNGTVNLNIESFIPFGIGQRMCSGEMLAKTELFLLFSTLFKTFEFKPSPEEGLPSMTDNIETLVLRPLPYKCCATPR